MLNHQFLQIDVLDLTPPKGGAAYEAMVFVGYDHASERDVAHWIDIYGAQALETLGFG